MRRRIKNVLAITIGVVAVISWLLNLSGKQAAVQDSQCPVDLVPAKVSFLDSLDANRVAPLNYQVLFENDSVRLFKVLIPAHTREPIHIHRWPGFSFGESGPGAGNAAVVYFSYKYDSATGRLILVDSIVRQLVGPDFLDPDRPSILGPEGVHSVWNTRDYPLRFYRMEFKKK